MTWLVLSYVLSTAPATDATPTLDLRRLYTSPDLHLGAAPHLIIGREGPEIGVGVTFQVSFGGFSGLAD